MQRQRLEIDGPSTGEELAKAVEKIAQTPPAIVQRVIALFNRYKDER
jgi:hypothetical protein